MNPSFSHKKDWHSFLEEHIPDKIPGEKVHAEMAPLRQLSSEALKQASHVKESAVAIHLFEKNNNLHVILTQRNTYDGAHSGQVSFPGGKRDQVDKTLLETARRESFEEIGLDVSKGKLIGEITPIYIPVSQFKVTPFVFYHEAELFDLKPEPREVKSIFSLPGNILLDDKIIQLKDIFISKDFTLKNVPCFVYEEYIIWGATAILLNEMKHILRANF